MGRSITPRHHPDYRYPGLPGDLHGGMTDIGAIIRDAWVLGLLPETQDCRGWTLAQVRALGERVEQAWARHGHSFHALPAALQQRYLRIQESATRRAREHGWRPAVRHP